MRQRLLSLHIRPFLIIPIFLFAIACDNKSLSVAPAQDSASTIAQVAASHASLASSVGETYNFGTTVENSSNVAQINISNIGSVAANILSLNVGANSAFTIQSQTCGSSLAINASCSVSVQFLPTAAAVTPGALTLTYADAGTSANPQSLIITLNGAGSPQPVGHLSFLGGVAPNFGSVPNGTQVQLAAYITNDGSAPVTGLTIGPLSGDFSFVGSATVPGSSSCVQGGTLAAGTGCSLVVSFSAAAPAPITTPVQETASSIITYGNGTSNVASFSMAVSGMVVGPQIAISGNIPVAFQGIIAPPATIPTACLTLTNISGVALSNIQLAGSFVAPFSLGVATGCANPVCIGLAQFPAGALCDIPVAFNPSTAGNFSSPVGVNYTFNTLAVNVNFSVEGTTNVCNRVASATLNIPGTTRPVMDRGYGYLKCMVNGVLTTDQNAVPNSSNPNYPCGFNTWGYRNGNQSQYSVDASQGGNTDPVLLMAVTPGQVLYVNSLSGSVQPNPGDPALNCAQFQNSTNGGGMPTLQFVDANGNVVAVSTRNNNQSPLGNNAVLAYSLLTSYIVVPPNAVSVYGSWPDNVYSDNSGSCHINLTTANVAACATVN